MAKFNVNKMRGISEDRTPSERKGTIGQGLLNDASKAQKVDALRIKFIPVDLIRRSTDNFYSIGDIKTLKLSIERIGLKQPLIVHLQEDGTYLLLGGERRLTAIEELMREGKWQDDKVPCVLQDYDRVDLPIGDEMKELYCIITTNREQRDYTDADLANEIYHLKEIYASLREAGVEEISLGVDEAGNEITRSIKCIKTRDLISEDLHISTGKLAAFDKVENKGTEAVKQALLDNKLSVMKASRIADLPVEEQEAALMQELAPKEAGARVRTRKQRCRLTSEEAGADIKPLLELTENFSEKELSESEYRKYVRAVLTIKKVLGSVG